MTTTERGFEYLTEWKWYWKDGDDTWQEYSGKVFGFYFNA